MRSLLYASLTGFYAAEAVRRCPAWLGRGVVVHRDGTVLDSSPEARGRRVVPGTPLREAKAVLRADGVFLGHCEEDTRPARDAWLDVCAAFSDTVEPGMPHEAWVDLSRHPDPARTAYDLLARLGEATGLPLRAGMAPGKWLARLAAEVSSPTPPLVFRGHEPSHEKRGGGSGVAALTRRPCLARVSDPAGFLAPLPTALLSPVAPAHRERLEFLGYRRVGQVARAPWPLLKAQFGQEAGLIHEAANGRALDPARALYPPDAVSERVDFAAPLDDRGILDAALVELAARLARSLCDRDRIGDLLILVLEPESGPPAVRRRALARPVKSACPLRVALSAMVGEHPPFAPVAVRGVMPGLRPAPCVQRSLATTGLREERVRAVETALRSLRASFGGGSVVRASEVTPLRRHRVLKAWREATGWR